MTAGTRGRQIGVSTAITAVCAWLILLPAGYHVSVSCAMAVSIVGCIVAWNSGKQFDPASGRRRFVVAVQMVSLRHNELDAAFRIAFAQVRHRILVLNETMDISDWPDVRRDRAYRAFRDQVHLPSDLRTACRVAAECILEELQRTPGVIQTQNGVWS